MRYIKIIVVVIASLAGRNELKYLHKSVFIFFLPERAFLPGLDRIPEKSKVLEAPVKSNVDVAKDLLMLNGDLDQI
jgi:hypothetical protein